MPDLLLHGRGNTDLLPPSRLWAGAYFAGSAEELLYVWATLQ